MTPIYKSPDHDQSQAMRSLLLGHGIQSSIIETKNSNNAMNSSTVTWYELWLRHVADLARAKTIITQHEFTTFKTSMSSYRTSVGVQKTDSITKMMNIVSSKNASAINSKFGDNFGNNSGKNSESDVLLKERPLSQHQSQHQSQQKVAEPTPREDLIPINNKRVFERLGLLLGFSEEEIHKQNNNKLYRPWDADELNESVKNLKLKCS
jgi:hypothetical protein